MVMLNELLPSIINRSNRKTLVLLLYLSQDNIVLVILTVGTF